jgi:hypothetical protein
MRLGRTHPDLDPEPLFESDEWRAAFILNKQKPPKMPRRLNEVVRLVAMLGGFLDRKAMANPASKRSCKAGVQNHWLGAAPFGVRHLNAPTRQWHN